MACQSIDLHVHLQNPCVQDRIVQPRSQGFTSLCESLYARVGTHIQVPDFDSSPWCRLCQFVASIFTLFEGANGKD